MIILRHSITSKLLKKMPKVLSFYDICKLIYLGYIQVQFGNKFYEYDWKIYYEQTSASASADVEVKNLHPHPHPWMCKI